MKLASLSDLLMHQLVLLRRAESESIDVLARMRSAALSSALGAAFEDHRRRAQVHVERLARLLAGLSAGHGRGADARGTLGGLLQECLELLHEDAEPHVRDAMLIALAQRLEHEEIAGYGCARTWATLVGEDQAAAVLQRCLDDAREIDQRLTVLAHGLNREAMIAGCLQEGTDGHGD